MTVFIGKNNAGKSSLLESLELILFNKSIESHNYLLSKNNNQNGTGTVVISVTCNFSKKEWDNCFHLSNIKFDQYITRPDTTNLLEIPIKIERTFSYIDGVLKNHTNSHISIDQQFTEKFKETDKMGIVNAIERLNQSFSNGISRFTNVFFFSGERYLSPTEGFIPFDQLKQNPSREHTRNELFYLKNNDVKNYDKIMDRMGDFFNELGSIDVFHNLNNGMIELQITEGDYNTGLEQMGSGIKRIIQILSRILSSESTVAILDEPETHMHPKLVRKFVDCINEISGGDIQLIISTHNEQFVDSVDIHNILYLKPISPVASEIKLLSEQHSELSGLLQELEIVQDNFTKFETTSSKMIVFGEGPTDWDHIVAYSKRLNLYSQLEFTNIHFVPLGGYKIIRNETIEILSKYDIPYLVLYDRDERTDEQIEKIEKKLTKRRVHYLKKREFENYSIDSEAIYTVIQRRLISRPLEQRPDISKTVIDKKIKELADSLKSKVILKGFIERVSNQLSLQFLQFDIRREFIKKNLGRGDEEIIDSFYSNVFVAITKYTKPELKAILEQVRESINQQWEADYLSICFGKDLLVSIRKWLLNDFQISSISSEEIILNQNVVNPEIKELIEKIIKAPKCNGK